MCIFIQLPGLTSFVVSLFFAATAASHLLLVGLYSLMIEEPMGQKHIQGHLAGGVVALVLSLSVMAVAEFSTLGKGLDTWLPLWLGFISVTWILITQWVSTWRDTLPVVVLLFIALSVLGGFLLLS